MSPFRSDQHAKVVGQLQNRALRGVQGSGSRWFTKFSVLELKEWLALAAAAEAEATEPAVPHHSARRGRRMYFPASQSSRPKRRRHQRLNNTLNMKCTGQKSMRLSAVYAQTMVPCHNCMLRRNDLYKTSLHSRIETETVLLPPRLRSKVPQTVQATG